MAKLKIILEDDQGQALTESALEYNLPIEDGNFSTLEGEVDKLKKDASAKITAALLEHMQAIVTKKKSRRVGEERDKIR